MKSHKLVTVTAMAAILSAFAINSFAAEEKDEEITMDKVPAAVQQTLKKQASGSDVKKIEKGDVDGKTAYEFEISKGGKNSEITISPDGKLMGTEEELQLSDLPEAVTKTINAQAAGAKVESAEKVLADGKITYEAVFEKDGKKTEVTVTPDGKLVSTEEAGKD